jgi:hypothetical protein
MLIPSRIIRERSMLRIPQGFQKTDRRGGYFRHDVKATLPWRTCHSAQCSLN